MKAGTLFSYIFLLSCTFLSAQVCLVSVAEDKEYRVGEKFRLSIIMQSDVRMEKMSTLRLPDFSNFKVVAAGAEESTFPKNDGSGTYVRQVIHQFVLIPKKAGTAKIGSAIVWANDIIYKSDAFDINIKAARKELFEEVGLQITAAVPKNEVYLKENISVELRAVSENINFIRSVKLHLPNSSEEYDAEFYPANASITRLGASDVYEKSLGVLVLHPKKAGIVSLKPLYAEYFNGEEILAVRPQPLQVRVKNLPPSSKNGHVGAFTFSELKILPGQKLESGSLVKLRMDVKGKTDWKNFRAPKLATEKDIFQYKPKIKFHSDKSGKGSAQITYYVKPAKAGTFQLKTDPYTSFNSETGTTNTHSASPVTLLVSPVQNEIAANSINTLDKIKDFTANVVQNVTPGDTKTAVITEQDAGFYTKNFWWLNGLLWLSLFSAGTVYLRSRRKKKNKSVPSSAVQTSKPEAEPAAEKVSCYSAIEAHEAEIKEKLRPDMQQKLTFLKNAASAGRVQAFWDLFFEISPELKVAAANASDSHLAARYNALQSEAEILRFGKGTAENYQKLAAEAEHLYQDLPVS